MPLPFILGLGAVIAGAAGVGSGINGAMKIKDANDTIKSAERQHKENIARFEATSERTNTIMDNLGKLELNILKSFEKFSDVIEKIQNRPQFKSYNINGVLLPKYDKEELRNVSVGAGVLLGGLGGAAAGTAGGFAAAGATTAAVMALGTASTGTAIASLSGAAATNATLAWFGGGSLAAGGLGVAGGTVVLGGVVAAPVIAVAGFIMEAKSQEKLAQAQKVYAEAENAAAKMATMTSALKAIYDIADMDNDFIQVFSLQYHKVLNQLATMRDSAHAIQEKYLGNRIRKLLGLQIKVDYRKLTTEQQQTLHIAWLMTQLLYSTLTTPILAKNGDLDEKSKEKIYALKNESKRFLEA